MRSSEDFKPKVDDIPEMDDIENTKEIKFVDLESVGKKARKRYGIRKRKSRLNRKENP